MIQITRIRNKRRDTATNLIKEIRGKIKIKEKYEHCFKKIGLLTWNGQIPRKTQAIETDSRKTGNMSKPTTSKN